MASENDTGRGGLAWTYWLPKAAAAGLVGGLVMLLFVMLGSWLAGDGFWTGPRAVAALFFGTGELGQSFALGPVVLGAVIHLALALVFAVIWAFIIGAFTLRVPTWLLVVAGLLWGLLLWLLLTFLVAPELPGGELVGTVQILALPAWAWSVGHLLYGAVLGWLYASWRDDRTTLLR